MPRKTLSSTTPEALQMEEAPHWSLFTGVPLLLRFVRFEKSPHDLSGFPLLGILSASSSFFYFFLDNFSPLQLPTWEVLPLRCLVWSPQTRLVRFISCKFHRQPTLLCYRIYHSTVVLNKLHLGGRWGWRSPGLIHKSICCSRTGMRPRSGSCTSTPGSLNASDPQTMFRDALPDLNCLFVLLVCRFHKNRCYMYP